MNNLKRIVLGISVNYMKMFQKIPNYMGDRDIEWSFISSHIPEQVGNALDFGNGGSALGLIAAMKGYDVTAIDMTNVQWPYTHAKLKFIQNDLFKITFDNEIFDLVINCSVIEHVGVIGRYGVSDEKNDGDIEAMEYLHKLMKPNAIMLLTVPVGIDDFFPPLARVYGVKRLPKLLKMFSIIHEEYWSKESDNKWQMCSKNTALSSKTYMDSRSPLRNYSPLGCFVLQK